MAEKGKENQNGHEQKGDLIHNIIAHMEHLMDIFEIGIAVIVRCSESCRCWGL